MPFSSEGNRSNERSQWISDLLPLLSPEVIKALGLGFNQQPAMNKSDTYYGFPPGEKDWGVFDPISFLNSLTNPNINYTSGEWTDMGVSSTSTSTSSSITSLSSGVTSGTGSAGSSGATSGTSSVLSSVMSSSFATSGVGSSSILSSVSSLSSIISSGVSSSGGGGSTTISGSSSTSTIGIPDDDCQDCYAEVVYPDGTIDYIGGCGAEEGPFCWDEVNAAYVQVPWTWAACFEPEIALSNGVVYFDSDGAHCNQSSQCPLFILNDEGSTLWELCSCAICNGCSTCVDRGYQLSGGYCYVNFYCCYVRRFGVSETLPPCQIFGLFNVLVWYPTSDEVYCPQLCDGAGGGGGGGGGAP
jgi:hypothetical protein